MYSMWKIMCFLNHEPRKHTALHQIHKIMLFLATSYDPFKLFRPTSNSLKRISERFANKNDNSVTSFEY